MTRFVKKKREGETPPFNTDSPFILRPLYVCFVFKGAGPHFFVMCSHRAGPFSLASSHLTLLQVRAELSECLK